MTGQQSQEEALIQNLKDAGCASDVIDLFMRYHGQKKISEQVQILTKQRYQLLDYVHDSQRKLDCLDYLLQKLKNKKE